MKKEKAQTEKGMQSTFITTITEIILWDFLMLYQIFLSPQVK